MVRIVIVFRDVQRLFFNSTSLWQWGLKFWNCFLFHL